MATAQAETRRAVRTAEIPTEALIRLAEAMVGGVILLLALQYILGFDLLDAGLWQAHARRFVNGILGTLGYVALILPVSVGLGFTLGWARVLRFRAISWPVAVYVDFFRGVPPLVVVIFASILGPLALPERFQSEGLGLTLGAIAIAAHSAAYQAEIFRAGFQSVSRGQLEAAQAIGMTPSGSMQHVILPQALRLSLPPLANEFAVVIKDTSLLAAIGADELFRLSSFTQQSIIRGGGEVEWLFVIWTSAAVVYFLMTFVVTRFMRLLERKFHARGLEGISI